MNLYKNQFNRNVAIKWDELIDWNKRLKTEKKFLSKILKKHSCQSILDVATGTGFDSILLSRQGFDVYSVDSSSEMLTIAKKNFDIYKIKPKLKLIDWENLNKIKKKFDAIICLGNSLACELSSLSRFKAVKNFNLVLKNNGIVIIDHRNYENFKTTINLKKNFYYLNNKVKIHSRIINYCKKKITLFKYSLKKNDNFFLKMCPIYLNYIYQIFIQNKFQLITTYKDREINNNNPSFYLHVFKKK
jgi:ubiquinone/menaquinone biosynthesis C-methylase UbiE